MTVSEHDTQIEMVEGDTSSELAAAELKQRETLAELHTARDAYSRAIDAHAASERALLRAQRSALEALASQALATERAELDTAISSAAHASRVSSGVVVADGSTGKWPHWLEPKMQEAAQQAGPGEIPGVLLVRGIGGKSHEPDPAVALVLDVTGRVSRPVSGLTAGELARRKQAR